MSAELKNRKALLIEPARDGGWVVKEAAPMNMIWEVLFAGNLAQCLQYQGEYYYGKDHGDVIVEIGCLS